MEKLNKDFIDKIRLSYSDCTYLFNKEENTPIVPKNKTHSFLLRSFTINDAILDFYYSHTNRFFSNDEYEKMKNTGYVGQKEHTLSPYPINIYGAYFNRIDLITKLQSIMYQNIEERPKLNGNSVEYFSDLIPYFKEYAEGFKDSYENFERNWVNEYLPAFPDKNDYTNKVFEYLTKKIIFEHDWYNNHCGFTIAEIVDEKKLIKGGEIVNAFEDGQKQGFFYKAWSIVFSNNNLFCSLFEQLNKENQPQQPETNKPDEVTKELHNHIFKGNAFEVFEKYHNNKSLAENSKTDLSLLFQLFEKDNLFVETVELKHYIQWLNKTYGYGLTTIKKVDINSNPNIQRTNDYKEYKRTTLKQP